MSETTERRQIKDKVSPRCWRCHSSFIYLDSDKSEIVCIHCEQRTPARRAEDKCLPVYKDLELQQWGV